MRRLVRVAFRPATASMSAAHPATAQRAVPASSFMLIGMLALLWGCNWPVLKVGVTELAPLTFRAASPKTLAIALASLESLSGVDVP